ncbi:unnamed protein product [Protopolystoma xenopodis]|uniref:Brix domain-containing protein n=1 Tax=Protopolystoma xenopodis TaxID=117903 RepID=A0A3S4ZES3_9PLAT|nr:unnamed protein product [Protopolystoma xenopodis]
MPNPSKSVLSNTMEKTQSLYSHSKDSHGLSHLSSAKKAAIRLIEIGPRITLQLIKIEEGVDSGAVLYHCWQARSFDQLVQDDVLRQRREQARAARRAACEAARAKNLASKEAHKAACLEGMRKAGHLPVRMVSV